MLEADVIEELCSREARKAVAERFPFFSSVQDTGCWCFRAYQSSAMSVAYLTARDGPTARFRRLTKVSPGCTKPVSLALLNNSALRLLSSSSKREGRREDTSVSLVTSRFTPVLIRASITEAKKRKVTASSWNIVLSRFYS